MDRLRRGTSKNEMVSHLPNQNPIPNSIPSISTSKRPRPPPNHDKKTTPQTVVIAIGVLQSSPRAAKDVDILELPQDVHWMSIGRPRGAPVDSKPSIAATAYIKPGTFPLFVTSALNHWSLFPSSLNNRRGKGY